MLTPPLFTTLRSHTGFWLFLKPTEFFPISGPLHTLFPLLGFFTWFHLANDPTFSFQLKWHFLIWLRSCPTTQTTFPLQHLAQFVIMYLFVGVLVEYQSPLLDCAHHEAKTMFILINHSYGSTWEPLNSCLLREWEWMNKPGRWVRSFLETLLPFSPNSSH